MKMSTFSVSCKNLSVSTTFSKTHKWTWDLHPWIARNLNYIGKLLRSQLNSRILRNLHVCDQSLKIFDSHIEIKFLLRLYYSRAQKRSTSHVIWRVRAASDPRQGRKNIRKSSETTSLRKILHFRNFWPMQKKWWKIKFSCTGIGPAFRVKNKSIFEISSTNGTT